VASSEKKWVCSVCGYEYDGDAPFESLTDDYECPTCGQPKSVFEAE
jgi:rubredoxin